MIKINIVNFVPGPLAGQEAGEGKRFAIVNVTIVNLTSADLDAWNVFEDAFATNYFTDADGENYAGTGPVFKASADEASEGNFAPVKARTVRLAFIVPVKAQLKTLTFGCAKGKHYVFDALAWN